MEKRVFKVSWREGVGPAVEGGFGNPVLIFFFPNWKTVPNMVHFFFFFLVVYIDHLPL